MSSKLTYEAGGEQSKCIRILCLALLFAFHYSCPSQSHHLHKPKILHFRVLQIIISSDLLKLTDDEPSQDFCTVLK